MADCTRLSRRAFLKATTCGAITVSSPGALTVNAGPQIPLPSSPVGIARCRRYDFNTIKAALSGLIDQMGGVQALVRGKTVSVKVNLTGGWNATTLSLSPIHTVYTHPMVVLAACSLFQDNGARRIVICESLYTNDETRLAYSNFGYDVALFESTLSNLAWEDTHNRGTDSNYRSLRVAGTPYLYSSFFFNHRYVDTDVMVSIPKMKNHLIAGITLGMKNMVGSTPSALYSSDKDDEKTTSARVAVVHEGGFSAAGGELLPVPSRDPGFRVPRAIVDIVRARPIDLVIIDGIVTMTGGEGPWHNTRLGIAVPNLIIAGKNCVCTDAVAAAVMGYDPEAAGGNKPFYNGANHLRLAGESGVGTNRLSEIDVVGLDIQSARYAFQPTYRDVANPDY